MFFFIFKKVGPLPTLEELSRSHHLVDVHPITAAQHQHVLLFPSLAYFLFLCL